MTNILKKVNRLILEQIWKDRNTLWSKQLVLDHNLDLDNKRHACSYTLLIVFLVFRSWMNESRQEVSEQL